MLIVGRIINGFAVGVSLPDHVTHLSALTRRRFVLLKFRFTSPSLHHQVNVEDSLEHSNGLSRGVS